MEKENKILQQENDSKKSELKVKNYSNFRLIILLNNHIVNIRSKIKKYFTTLKYVV